MDVNNLQEGGDGDFLSGNREFELLQRRFQRSLSLHVGVQLDFRRLNLLARVSNSTADLERERKIERE